jgi:GNAT superfamily N-acetyltransferase
MSDLTLAADRVHAGYHALGNTTHAVAGGTLVTNRAHVGVHDANVLVHPQAPSMGAADAVVTTIAHVLPSAARPHVHMGGSAHGTLEARLAADGWEPTMTLELVLHDGLRGDHAQVDIRAVTSESDWDSVARLYRADHVEEAVREERMPYPELVTRAIVDVKRAKWPAVRVWLARDDGVDCGFFTSWSGVDGVGMVEDLFVLPEHRGRGVARALIHRAVADARARGAGPVLIGALIDDTPKDLYQRMGFVPLMVRRCWLGGDTTDGREAHRARR